MNRQQLVPFSHLGDAIAPPQHNAVQPPVQPPAEAAGGLTVRTSLQAGSLMTIAEER